MTATRIKNVPITNVGGQPLQVPYDFYSEFKPQSLDVEFRVKVLDQGNSRRYNLGVYRGSVLVEEPTQSLFDLQLLSVYAVMALVVAGAAYLVYQQYLAAYFPKAPRKRTQAPRSAQPAATHDEWLPEQNVRARKAVPKRR